MLGTKFSISADATTSRLAVSKDMAWASPAIVRALRPDAIVPGAAQPSHDLAASAWIADTRSLSLRERGRRFARRCADGEVTGRIVEGDNAGERGDDLHLRPQFEVQID